MRLKQFIFALTAMLLSFASPSFAADNNVAKVATKAELNAALAAAKDGDVITLTADIDYGTDQLAIAKAITLDLGGKTLTTRNAWGGMSIKNNPTVKNGNIVHASNTAAIKVWNATAFEDLVIDVQGKGDANKTIGGIVLQSGSTTRVGSIKNVTIKGAALTNGIETYNCGDATENVIGSMENVTIDALGTGLLISAPCGTATNCDITGGVNGVEIFIKGNYSASLDLDNSKVNGGVYAHDEFSSNPSIVNNGTLNFTANAATTGASAEDVTLEIARAEADKVQGVLKEVMDNAQAKLNNVYYATLADAISAAQPGETVMVFEGTYAVPTMKAGITIEGVGNVLLEGTLSGTLENLTLKNLHIKGGNAQRWAYAKGDLLFENVIFEATSVYALHFDGIAAGTKLTYKNCTIIGWAAMGGTPESCVFDGCTIKDNGTYGVIRTYFDATIKNCRFDVANANTGDVYQDGIHAVGGAKIVVNGCTNANGDMKDLVNVNGASVVIVDGVEFKNVANIGETYYETLDAAFAAAQDNDEVKIIAAGTYALTTSGKNITITGTVEGVVFDNIGTKNMGSANVTFNNVTFDYYPNVNYTGLQHSGNLTYNDCIINGQVFLYGQSETFNKCTFNQNSADAYNVWTYGAKDVDFNECTFNSVGKSVLVYNESTTATNDVAFTNCVLKASAAVEGKAAIEIDTSLSAGATITVDGATTATGFGSGNVSGNSLWNNKKGSNTDANNDITVVVNNETVLAPVTFVAKIGETGYRTIAEAITAAQAGETVKVFEGTYAVPAMKAGITIEGAVNADGTPAVLLEGTLKGTLDNLTLKNLHIKGGNAQRWAYAKGDLLFENVIFEATSVYALHFDGIAAGTKLIYKNCTIIGWAAMSGSPESCVFDGCTIKDNGTYGVIRTYFDATIKNCRFDVANANTGDVYQDGIHAVGGAKIAVNNCTNANGEMKDLVNVNGASVVTVDGVEFKNVAKIGDNYYATINEAIAAIGAGEVVIELLADATFDYNARDAYGTAETTSVTIKGNGKTLTLNQKNSDWASIGLANGKLVLNDMTIEKTGYGDTSGAWNTHAIIFSCPVEMNNVTVNNGIAVQAGATLNNVTINEANGYYGLWINGNGQAVTVNGGAINATNGGRGIKIADQYIDAPAQVRLNVDGTVFSTAKKAAVLVSSTAGAHITASNVDIAEVAEDNVNFVWVDEDWAQHFANVQVEGATKAQESMDDFAVTIDNSAYFKTLTEAIAAATSGQTITLIGDVKESVTIGKNINIDGKGRTITGTITLQGSNIVSTVKNVNFVDGSGYAITTNGIKSITVENCTVTNYGIGFLYANKSTPTVTVKNVTVDGGNNGFHWVYGTSATLENVKMTNVENGLYIQNYAGKTITLKNCEICSIGIWERNGYSGVQTFKLEGCNTIATLPTSQYAKLIGATITGTTFYGSVQGMVEKAETGKTVQLLSDITLDATGYEMASCDGYPSFVHVEGKAITVDLNGKTIAADVDADDVSNFVIGVFSTDKGGELTLVDNSAEGTGTVELDAEDGKVYSLICNYNPGCKITINGGTYVANKVRDCLIFSGAYEDALVTVNGGNFTLGNVGTGENGKPWIFNVLGAGDNYVLVKGGTFNADINRQFWSNEVLVPETYYTVANTDSTYTVKEGAVAYVSEGMLTGPYFVRKNVGYATLGEAFAAADDDDTVTLLENIEYTKATAGSDNGEYVDGLVYTGDKSFTVDFAGKTVTENGEINDYLVYLKNTGKKENEITFKNGTIAINSQRTATAWAAITVGSGSSTHATTLNLEGMKVINGNPNAAANQVIRSRNGATVNLNEGTLVTSNGTSYGVVAETTATVNINDGAKVVHTNSKTTGGNQVYTAVSGNGTINVYDGAEIVSDNYGIHNMTTGNAVINIYGGTITAPVIVHAATNGGSGESADVYISGGRFFGAMEEYTNNANIHVSNGVFDRPVAEEFCAEDYAPCDNADGTYGVYYAVLDNFEIIDGDYTEFENPMNMTVKGTLTYKRTLNANNIWLPLFVPFEIPVSYLNERGYEVATFYDVHFSILEGGVVDLESVPDIHLIKINGGTLKANYPYVIRAKSDASLDLVITLEDVTLYSTAKSKLNVVESSTTTTRFEFAGTYVRATGEQLTGDANVPFYVITKKGEMAQFADPSSRLSPFRVYMTIWNKDGSHVILNGNPAASIAMRVIGEENEDGTTSIYDVYENVDSNGMIFDLQGRRVLEPQKGGMYIIDGKKVIY